MIWMDLAQTAVLQMVYSGMMWDVCVLCSFMAYLKFWQISEDFDEAQLELQKCVAWRG